MIFSPRLMQRLNQRTSCVATEDSINGIDPSETRYSAYKFLRIDCDQRRGLFFFEPFEFCSSRRDSQTIDSVRDYWRKHDNKIFTNRYPHEFSFGLHHGGTGRPATDRWHDLLGTGRILPAVQVTVSGRPLCQVSISGGGCGARI